MCSFAAISQCVDVHLLFMAFLLQDGALYMPNKRAGEVWDTLIANPNSCEDDRAVSGAGEIVSVLHSCVICPSPSLP